MSETYVKEGIFEYHYFEGTSYEIGKMQGEIIKNQPEALKLYTTPSKECGSINKNELDKILKFNEEFCPGINDEISGFSDSIKVPLENIIYYAETCPKTCNCSHMAILPSITKDGHIYVGRSYEWSLDEEMRLCTTKVKGKAAHIGFSLFLFGRFDGINEHGLCVTMSAAVPGSMPEEKGFRFWAILRSLLDNCKTVNDAIYLIKKIPIAANFNLIVADRNGEAVLIEIACSNKSFKRIGMETKDKYICSTNHYTHKDMLQFDKNRMWQSVARYDAIETIIKLSIPKISKETLKGILSSTVPDGVCCHHYSEGLGTLWSMIFDLTDINVDICFGSPVYNEWNKFNLSGPKNSRNIHAKFPDEKVAIPQFWNRV